MTMVRPMVCDTSIAPHLSLEQQIERTNACSYTLFDRNIGSLFFCKGLVRLTDEQYATQSVQGLGIWGNRQMPCTLLSFARVQDAFKEGSEFRVVFENKIMANKILQVSNLAYVNGYEDLNLKNNTAVLYKFFCADGIFFHYGHPVVSFKENATEDHVNMRVWFDEIDLIKPKE